MVDLWTVNALLSGATVVVLVALLSIYLRNYRRAATAFGLGLAVFAALLLARSLFEIYAALSFQSLGLRTEVSLPMFFLSALELGALLVLFRLSWE